MTSGRLCTTISRRSRCASNWCRNMPSRRSIAQEFAATLNNIGVLAGAQKELREALPMFQLALTHSRHACTLAPHSVLWGRWMATSLRNIAYTQHREGQAQAALTAFQEQAEVWRRLVVQNPAVSQLRGDYCRALRALAEQQQLMGLSQEAMRSLRDARELLTQMPRGTAAELFDLATVYASLAARPDRTVEVMPDDDLEADDERQRNADEAMKLLAQAVDAGWSDAAAVRSYQALDPLRDRADFRELAALVEAKAEGEALSLDK